MSKGCKDCTKRAVGCHSHCENYLKYKEELERLREKEIADKDKHFTAWFYISKRIR